jgi:hypothetical protein
MACNCCAADRQFDNRVAQRDLRRFHSRGPDAVTRQLLSGVQQSPLAPAPTLLDIGGGVGVIQHFLLVHGFVHATQVGASQAHLAGAATEAQRRGHEKQATFSNADFGTAAPVTLAADVVTLNRVVCCDPEHATLMSVATEHAGAFSR